MKNLQKSLKERKTEKKSPRNRKNSDEKKMTKETFKTKEMSEREAHTKKTKLQKKEDQTERRPKTQTEIRLPKRKSEITQKTSYLKKLALYID